MKNFVCMAVAMIMLAACSNQGGYGNPGGIGKEGVGTVLGGAGGALLGSQIGGGTGKLVAVGAGTLLGAVLGNQVGQSLDRADMNYYDRTSQQALETGAPGQPLPWSNPSSGASGTVTPQNYYQNANGQYCREYSQSINVGGRTQQGFGTACRQPNGEWKIVQ